MAIIYLVLLTVDLPAMATKQLWFMAGNSEYDYFSINSTRKNTVKSLIHGKLAGYKIARYLHYGHIKAAFG